MFTSKKTTLAGVAAVMTGIAAILNGLASGDIASIDWMTAASSIIAGLGLLFARDNNKSSEDVGIK